MYSYVNLAAELSFLDERLRQTQKGLKNSCKIFEQRIARCLEVLPLCEQIVRFRIGIGELLAFHTAVCERAEMHNLSMESAAYRVIEDIQYYNKLGGMKKELSNVTNKVFIMNQFSARQNNAVMALIKLQSQGITEDQIFYLSKQLQKSAPATIIQKNILDNAELLGGVAKPV